MKIFSRMKSKFHWKDNAIKPEPKSMFYDKVQQSCKEEFSSCTNPLLAIGTFGSNLKDSENSNTGENLLSSEDHPENTTLKELREVDDQFLRLLLSKNISLDSSFSGESQKHCISAEQFLDSLPEDEEITEELTANESENEDALPLRATSAIRGRGKDTPTYNRKKGMYKKSLSFLLKKALLYRGGFLPSRTISPILKDPFPEPKVNSSRMEKMLRAMPHKKKYSQTPKYLDTNATEQEEVSEGNWVKTDSECNQAQISSLHPKARQTEPYQEH